MEDVWLKEKAKQQGGKVCLQRLREEYKRLDEYYDRKRRKSDRVWMILERDGLAIGLTFVILAMFGSIMKWMFKGIKKLTIR
jgi:hypothetical protein